MKTNRGITLVELLVVIVIVGILAAVAIPTYTGYMQRGRRSDAKTALEQLRAAQEIWRAEKGSYSNSLDELKTSMGVAVDPVGDYKLQWAGGFALNQNSFTAEAVPVANRQKGDKSLFINNLGQKWDSDGKYYPEGKWAK